MKMLMLMLFTLLVKSSDSKNSGVLLFNLQFIGKPLTVMETNSNKDDLPLLLESIDMKNLDNQVFRISFENTNKTFWLELKSKIFIKTIALGMRFQAKKNRPSPHITRINEKTYEGLNLIKIPKNKSFKIIHNHKCLTAVNVKYKGRDAITVEFHPCQPDLKTQNFRFYAESYVKTKLKMLESMPPEQRGDLIRTNEKRLANILNSLDIKYIF